MKKNNKGFTLVELLAVIAILAILVVIAMPNVLKLFRQSRQQSFENEVQTVKKELEKETFNSQLKGEKVPEIISSFGENQLDMDGRDLDYYAEMNTDGTIKYLEVSDGQFYYQYSETQQNGQVVDLEKDNPSSKMEYIKDNVSTEQIFLYENLYSIYDETNSIPIIMTNMSENEIKVNVSYGTAKLKEFILPPTSEDYIQFVKLSKSMIDAMKLNSTQNIKIDTEVNIGKDLENKDIIVKFSYPNKIKIKKENPDMIITKVTSSKNANIEYNQTGIFVPKNTDIGTLEVTVKNNSSSTYKFKNIYRSELKMKSGNINDKVYSPITIQGAELEKYENYLNGGVYFYAKRAKTFTMDFLSKNNIQKIYFDFDIFLNPGVFTDGNITIASNVNATNTKYGDFIVQNSSVANKYHGTTLCSLSACFGDGKLSYNSDKSLSLGLNKGVAILDIAQSMSVEDTYSVYMTIKADTNQLGKPSLSFPATILAISQENMKYLSWIGFYENYMQVYSYYNGEAKSGQQGEKTSPGFASFDISKYSNKTINIQITAKRGGTTNVYINGELVKSFASGTQKVDYNIATIGDLRPSRGLKFTGNMYDITIYNTVLDQAGISHNYNYAKDKWSIK